MSNDTTKWDGSASGVCSDAIKPGGKVRDPLRDEKLEGRRIPVDVLWLPFCGEIVFMNRSVPAIELFPSELAEKTWVGVCGKVWMWRWGEI